MKKINDLKYELTSVPINSVNFIYGQGDMFRFASQFT